MTEIPRRLIPVTQEFRIGPLGRVRSLFELGLDLTPEDLLLIPSGEGDFWIRKQGTLRSSPAGFLHRPEGGGKVVARVADARQQIDLEKGIGHLLLIPLDLGKTTLVLGRAANLENGFTDTFSEVDVMVGGNQEVTLSAYGGEGKQKREIGVPLASSTPVVVGREPRLFRSLSPYDSLRLSEEVVEGRGISRVHFVAFRVMQPGFPSCLAIEPLSGHGTYVKSRNKQM